MIKKHPKSYEILKLIIYFVTCIFIHLIVDF